MPPLIRVVTSAEAGARDRAAIDAGIPSRALMQRAGAATAAEIALRFRDRLQPGVLVFAGPGNNGGDAWVVARALAMSGVRVRVVEPVAAATEDAREERALALPHVELVDVNPAQLASASYARGERVIVDGLLGTGTSGAPRGAVAAAITAIRALRDRDDATVVAAIDVPSGLDATSGQVTLGARADVTFTYGTIKRGNLLARAACGRVVVLDIGLGQHAEGNDNAPAIVSSRWVSSRIPGIAPDAHKGTRRKIAIVGGGDGMSGAVILAARAAWRSGVGMVKLVVASASLDAVREAEPQSLTARWPEDESEARAIADWADAVAIGPGLGAGRGARDVIERVLTAFRGPAVLDADGLNAFNADVNGMARLLDRRPAILTPHPMEFARLAGVAVDDVQARRFDIGAAVARHTGAAVLLKGQPTVIFAPDGQRLVSASGSPLLAAAGSGDVLTGMVTTLLAQTRDPVASATCAAYVHGRAAMLVQRGKGVRGFSLDDVLATLPDAWNLRARPSRYPVLLELPDIAPRRAAAS